MPTEGQIKEFRQIYKNQFNKEISKEERRIFKLKNNYNQRKAYNNLMNKLTNR